MQIWGEVSRDTNRRCRKFTILFLQAGSVHSQAFSLPSLHSTFADDLQLGDSLLHPTTYHHHNLSHTLQSWRASPNVTTATMLESPWHGLPSADEHPLFYVSIFGAIGVGSVMIMIISIVIQMQGSFRASRLLFSQLLGKVVRATMRWHDTTPTGTPSQNFLFYLDVLIRSWDP